MASLPRAIRQLPDEAFVSGRWVREQFAAQADDDGPLADMTIGEVAEILERAPSTVRAYIRSGRLSAYRFGRQYRTTPAALRAFRDELRGGELSRRREKVGVDSVDLGSWRDELPSAA